MADFSVSITVPDGKAAELLDAINWHVDRRDENGDPDPMTSVEARAWLKDATERSLKGIFTRHKEYLRSQQAIDDSIDIT